MFYQHGDVLIKSSVIPQEAKREKIADKVILAEGEITGHAHVLTDVKDKVETFKHGNALYMRVKQPVIVKHEEHKSLTIQPGDYMIDRVKEFDPFEEEIRRVQD